MKYKIVKPSSVYPCGVDFVKNQLRITHSQHDLYISSLIAAATDWANGYTGRQINFANLQAFCSYPEIRSSHSSYRNIFIERGPVIEVTKVEYLNTSGNYIEITNDNYSLVSLDEYSAVIWIKNEFSFINPETKREDAIRITFTAGWDGSDNYTFPEVVKNAVAMKAARLYTNPDDQVDEKTSVSENLLKSMRCPIC